MENRSSEPVCSDCMDSCWNKLNEAITMHWSAEVTYMGLYSLCHQTGLPLTGMADFWRLAALRLRYNANQLLNHLIVRGGLLNVTSVSQLIDLPTSLSMDRLQDLLNIALNIEEKIERQLRSICDIAKLSDDPELEHFIASCLLHPQTRTIHSMRNLVTGIQHVSCPVVYDRLVMRPLVVRMCEHIARKEVTLLEQSGLLRGTGIHGREMITRILNPIKLRSQEMINESSIPCK